MARRSGSKVLFCSAFAHPAALALLLLAVIGVLGATLHTLLNRQNCLEPRPDTTAQAAAIAASAAAVGTGIGAPGVALPAPSGAAGSRGSQPVDAAAAVPSSPATLDQLQGQLAAPAGEGLLGSNLDSRREVFWLHIPKTGTSIANSFYRLICPAAPLDGEHTYYDNNLFKDFPPKQYCRHHWLPEGRTNGWHWPLTSRYTKTFSHPSEKKVIVLTMFREPAVRLASSYEFGRMFPPGWKGKKPIPKETTLEEYARLPGLLGCQTNMVLGYDCGWEGTLPENSARLAFERASQFDFFGITDAWEESVQLLHRSLGMPGSITRGELGNMRKGHEHKQENVFLSKLLRELGEPDLDLYPLVRNLFLQRLKKHGIKAPFGL